MSATLDKTQQIAADELIAVTGDKTIKRTWDLADAIIAATPNLRTDVLVSIRQAAVDKAGHDEFWGVQRLKQMGRTAQNWPQADRVADVSLDAHMEVYRKVGSTAEARKVILKVKSATGGASIRDLRAEMGANGTKAQPPRIDKAGIDEFWRRIHPRIDELKKHLRTRLKPDETEIVAFYSMFADLKGMIDQLNKTTPKASPEPAPAAAAPVQRKTRRKGL